MVTPPVPISLNEGEKEKLLSIVHSRTLGHSMVQCTQIVLACAEGEYHVMIAKRLGVSHVTVGEWHRRHLDQGVDGRQDQHHLDRPCPLRPLWPHPSAGHLGRGRPRLGHALPQTRG